MDDLVEWLRARLDEDERLALDAGGRRWGREAYCCVVDSADNRLIVYGEGTPSSDQADHIALHDPARALREVEAKRRIIEWVLEQQVPHSTIGDDFWYPVAVLATAYSDRPGYRAEWRPSD